MTNQEPSGDLISRVKHAIYKVCLSEGNKDIFIKILDEINKLSSVKQEPKTGHWIAIDEEPHEVWECDHCGFVIDGSGCIDPYDYRDTYKYCPNCGAKMISDEGYANDWIGYSR